MRRDGRLPSVAGGRHSRPIDGGQMADPFDRLCPACEGSGGMSARAWLDWVQTYRLIEFAIVDPVARLSALVDHMRAGSEPPPISHGTCPDCDGSGRVFTEPGRELMEFLRQHLPEIIERHLRDTRLGAAPGVLAVDPGGRTPHLRSI